VPERILDKAQTVLLSTLIW